MSLRTLLTSFPVCVTERLWGSTRVRKAPYRRPLFSLVAWQRNGRIVLVRSLQGLTLAFIPSTCYCPSSRVLMPLVSSQVPYFVPQEKKSARCCCFESLSDSGFIAQNLAFYRPNKAQTDISLANKRIT